MRLTPCRAVALAAAMVALPVAGNAQQAAPAPKPIVGQERDRPLPQSPAALRAALTERLNQNTVTVVSGNPNGTYLYLAYDLSAVLDDGNELRVLPVIGKGGYQNILDVLHLRGVDLGIAQANIITYLKKTGEFGPDIDSRLAYIARLYNEEMHVLAGSSIDSLKDLGGKKVNFSDVGSGTQFSTRRVFELLGIRAEEVNMGQADGYQKVKSGEIAATVLIAGKPTGSFAKFKLEPGMKLLPIAFTQVLEQDYLPSRLKHEDYPNLIPKDGHIDTIAIPSVLAVYNWPKESDRYRRVAKFVDAFFSKFEEFRRPPRHAKWKEANLTATLQGWKRFPAAEEWLAKNSAPQALRAPGSPIDPTFARAQAAGGAPHSVAEQERLFQKFMEWSKSQQPR